ncbi:acyltransferase ChoActase/COT/CPT [Fistulina hepatica ATCC 64428]|uniref:Acyltransferase ChoActase/COT/CPT n=1 Tax=Fistulina hepatica ATCC 64428 TaxID=1128425 RepID=A0A0D7A3Z5_9AGAR|nr:acyltransferase ChoActase/COT/CPT [Fistulina hepatica ATCC 64428]
MASFRTFEYQPQLPKLPIPPLVDTCRRYLRALEGLQDSDEHARTKAAVDQFLLPDGEGEALQRKLQEWNGTHDSYIEDFWYENYLSHSDPVVLALNPFFVLENDPNPATGGQMQRAASLIIATLGFIHDLRHGLLEPDVVRGKIPLDMDQFTRIFGTARIPTETGCKMQVDSESRHIVVLRRGQFYWFDVLDENNCPLLNQRELLRNLQAIVRDADQIDATQAFKMAIGVLTTENRKTWSRLRGMLKTTTPHNRSSLQIVDGALFVMCLDDAAEASFDDLCSNFLCGTYKLSGDAQVGTCINRWYDKLQIIVTADGAAGINFEHTGVDGHTVLRFAADVYTECLMLLARSINPNAHTLFNAPAKGRPYDASRFDTAPKQLVWDISPPLRAALRRAETRLGDLICQHECLALEFTGYGKAFITAHGFSPDAFVQMAFQAAYHGLYGRTECTYEPAMTKTFLHGRTEAIRTVQPESVAFTHIYFSDAPAAEKVAALRTACTRHVAITKECSRGLGQDRHLYALYCLLKRDSTVKKMPALFTDPGWTKLNASILSTSNCGNPALRLFGFGPVEPDGYGIGYIIKEDRISISVSSKHLQTRRIIAMLDRYLLDMKKLLVQLYRSANARPAPFIDHTGVLRDTKTGRPIDSKTGNPLYGSSDGEADGSDAEVSLPNYSFFEAGETISRRRVNGDGIGRRASAWPNIGMWLMSKK